MQRKLTVPATLHAPRWNCVAFQSWTVCEGRAASRPCVSWIGKVMERFVRFHGHSAHAPVQSFLRNRHFCKALCYEKVHSSSPCQAGWRRGLGTHHLRAAQPPCGSQLPYSVALQRLSRLLHIAVAWRLSLLTECCTMRVWR